MSWSKLSHLFQTLQQKIPRPWFRARSWRVLLEIFILQLVIAIITPFALIALIELFFGTAESIRGVAERNTLVYVLFIMLFNGASLLWGALRWRRRPPQRSRLKQIAMEWGMCGLIFFELALTLGLIYWIMGNTSWYTFLRPTSDPQFSSAVEMDVGLNIREIYDIVVYVSVLFGAIGFICLRVTLYILTFWNRLRRRYLTWALTHGQFMLVIWISVISYVLFSGLFLAFSFRNSPSFFEGLLTFLLGLGTVLLFTTVLDIIFVLPPSALFSFLFTRRTVRRIKDLTVATGSLRAGDYSKRVTVDGEDEVALLQNDFNVMAENLERTLRELQEERDNVSTLLQARRELIASVSHELRTPVATVRSYLESTLSTWNQSPPPTMQQDLQVMQQQVIRLQSLIDDLFTLARAEVGRLQMRTLPVNIELLVRRVAETMAPVVWRGSRVEVLADISPVTPVFPRVLADENRLEQILQNLLHNAVRHTPPGGIIVLAANADETSVILQVKDTGEGIAPEELGRIWERFYRAGNTHDKPSGGSGLGLTIVKELTEAMGGTITVASEVGQGTIFTISLPRIRTTQLTLDMLDQAESITGPLAITAKLPAPEKAPL